jgi:hypothetical protein
MRQRSLLSAILFFSLAVAAHGAALKTTRNLSLGDTEIKVNVFEAAGPGVTFVVPHHNEQTGGKIVKEYIDKYGGRMVEIESFDKSGKPARYVSFTVGGKSYSIDPNRIFTANGLGCNTSIVDVQAKVELFATAVLNSILVDGKKLFENDKFIVAVHNNTDIDTKAFTSKATDLTAFSFLNVSPSLDQPHGFYHDQAEGVFVSNSEDDPDNFVLLSSKKYLSFFADKGFNVVIQKAAAKLKDTNCSVDDGSLSVFSAQNDIPYICLEADSNNGGYRQRQMMEAVYQLAKAAQTTELLKE